MLDVRPVTDIVAVDEEYRAALRMLGFKKACMHAVNTLLGDRVDREALRWWIQMRGHHPLSIMVRDTPNDRAYYYGSRMQLFRIHVSLPLATARSTKSLNSVNWYGTDELVFEYEAFHRHSGQTNLEFKRLKFGHRTDRKVVQQDSALWREIVREF